MSLETGKREQPHVKYGKSGGAYRDMPDVVESELARLHAKSTVSFRFALRQSVKIVALGKISGSIVARGEKIGGHIYSVVWWAENKRYESWLYEHELEG